MLKNVPQILSPELVKVLCEMGHGDEIVIGDANFPAVTCGKRLVRADGISGNDLLEAILKVIPLDQYTVKPLALMATTNGDPTPEIWAEYENTVKKCGEQPNFEFMERYAFYDRAKNAFAVVASGEKAIYANVIIKKGVIK